MDQAYKHILNRYNRQVPRYTSYPPATRFQKGDMRDLYVSWLRQAKGDVSLYIHIPFCMKLCYYCGCHMRVVNNYNPIHDYLETLKQEIRTICRFLNLGACVTHIHFGGGSPTSIRPVDFRNLMDFIRSGFNVTPDAEISLEADPRNMSEGKIATYALCGVNRISLGVQDFNERVLNAINRPQPFSTTYNAVLLCRAYGINRINFDLMYGLPYQTVDTIQKTIKDAVALKPDRIAFFGYAHVPWMKKHMNLIPTETLPDTDDRFDLYHAGFQVLEKSGYVPIGIDHFVLPNDNMKTAFDHKILRRNFQGYTTDNAQTLIGLGLSSIGEFPDGYIQNETDFKAYHDVIIGGETAVTKSLKYNKDDLIYKYVIEKIMCYLYVDLDQVIKMLNLKHDFFDPCIEKLLPLCDDGIVVISGKKIFVQGDARIFTRLVCEAFDAYALAEEPFKRHAQAI